MSWENRGSMAIGGPQATVYSVDGGSNFRWARQTAETTQVYNTNYTDPALAIEAAWLWLNGLGGGVIRLRGPGETWTFDTQCDSQGDNVELWSDRSLLLQLTGVNAGDLLSITHDRIFFHGLYIDHNWESQNAGNCIHIVGSTHVYGELCRLINAKQYHIQVQTSSHIHFRDIEMNFCDLNDGLTFGSGCSYCSATNCYATLCEDVGFTAYNADDVTFEKCYAISNTAAGAHGFTCQSSIRTKFIACKAELNNEMGFMVNKPTDDMPADVKIIGCDSINNGDHGIQVWEGTHVTIENCNVRDNASHEIDIIDGDYTKVINCTCEGDQTSIHADTAADLMVIGNYLTTSGTGLDINNAGVVECIVALNHFNNCGAGVADGAAVNPNYGWNLNSAALWIENATPV